MPWRTAFSTSGWSSSGGSSSSSIPGLDRDVDREAGAEADLLDRQVAFGEAQLLPQGDGAERALAQALAQELGEVAAHPAGFGRLGGDQGADRVEAVEEEVRVELGLQGAQLRFLGEEPQLEGAAFGLLGGEEREVDVVRGGGDHRQHEGEQEDQRGAAFDRLAPRPGRSLRAGGPSRW